MIEYKRLLTDVLEHGEEHLDRTGVGTISLFGYQMRCAMRYGFPIATIKRVPFRWCVNEFLWMLGGHTDNGWLKERGVDIWDEWADDEHCSKFGRAAGDLGPVYGGLWRQFPVGIYDSVEEKHITPGYVDQIRQLVYDIQHQPNSRRLIVSGWHPYYQKRVALPPCHTLWQIKCHEENKSMSLHLYARSIDSFLGLPFDLCLYALILESLAWATGYTARDLVISFGDLHIYSNHMQQVNTVLQREPRGLPELVIIADKISTDPMHNLLNLREEHFLLKGYNPHPRVTAPVAI